jgi:hypothetical protein
MRRRISYSLILYAVTSVPNPLIRGKPPPTNEIGIAIMVLQIVIYGDNSCNIGQRKKNEGKRKTAATIAISGKHVFS